MTPQAVAQDRWTERRRRAAELQERWPFAVEVLTFYRVLLPVQERVYGAVQAELSDPSRTAAYVAGRALPLVREVTVACGPEKLARAAAAEDISPAEWEEKVRYWLAGGELSAVDRYLARAAAGPVLEALGGAAGNMCQGPRDLRHCPTCGGLPQVSVFASTGEDLVAPRRYLECARCVSRWPYPRMTCPACGETETGRLPIFAEEGATLMEATGHVVRGASSAPAGAPSGAAPHFPYVTIHACRACARYLLNIDLGRDARAVPVVDEMAAIPLDLYAREQGLMKIVPNLMGF
jgi:hypothetical protein